MAIFITFGVNTVTRMGAALIEIVLQLFTTAWMA